MACFDFGKVPAALSQGGQIMLTGQSHYSMGTKNRLENPKQA